jgi:hypothetical protein
MVLSKEESQLGNHHRATMQIEDIHAIINTQQMKEDGQTLAGN